MSDEAATFKAWAEDYKAQRDALQSQNQALQERAEKAEARLRLDRLHGMALQERIKELETERDKWEAVLVAADRVHEAYDAALADRNPGSLAPWTLSPTQETDPE